MADIAPGEEPGIVIVGGGQAAASASARLRKNGYLGKITILGEEPLAPYQRPPLSKAYLLGKMPLDRLPLRGPSWWEENGIGLRTGIRITGLDNKAHTVETETGEVIPYDKLLLATGAAPRRLPAEAGGELSGVYTIRTLADIDAMADEFRAGARLVIAGAGYIGLEAAAVARLLGLEVTVLHSASRVLSRVACAETAAAVRQMHVEHGVTIRENSRLSRLIGDEEGRVMQAELEDGTRLDADFVIAGIGVLPGIGLAVAAGLSCDNGIAVDEFCRTSDPAIWSAGDCASFPYRGTRIRLESVGNAIDMAETAADNMMGAGKSYRAKPWFWSDQYDAKLQIAGLGTGYTKIVSRKDTGLSFWYFRGEELIAVDALNDPRAYMVGKRVIESGKPVTAEQVRTETDLKALMK